MRKTCARAPCHEAARRLRVSVVARSERAGNLALAKKLRAVVTASGCDWRFDRDIELEGESGAMFRGSRSGFFDDASVHEPKVAIVGPRPSAAGRALAESNPRRRRKRAGNTVVLDS